MPRWLVPDSFDDFMAKPLPSPFDKAKVVAENRRARYDYFVEERFEAGIELMGTEVKALRTGEGSIAESYATVGAVDKVVPVDLVIKGCPPKPIDLVKGLLALMEQATAKSVP